MAVAIRLAESDADREKVYRLRYQVYVEEMRRPQKYADHTEKRIKEPLDGRAHIFAAFHKDTVVGTVRVNFARDGDLGYYPELYCMQQAVGDSFPGSVSMSTKLIVAPELRGGTLSTRLAVEAYQFGLSNGILFDFIDCNRHLEAYFRKLGYREYQERIQHPEYGDVLPMMLCLADFERLAALRSPFARLCRSHRGLGIASPNLELLVSDMPRLGTV